MHNAKYAFFHFSMTDQEAKDLMKREIFYFELLEDCYQLLHTVGCSWSHGSYQVSVTNVEIMLDTKPLTTPYDLPELLAEQDKLAEGFPQLGINGDKLMEEYRESKRYKGICRYVDQLFESDRFCELFDTCKNVTILMYEGNRWQYEFITTEDEYVYYVHNSPLGGFLH
jgi:hypothetical protein